MGRKLRVSGLALFALALCAELGLRIRGYDPLGGTQLADGAPGTILRIADDPRQRYELTPGASGLVDGIEVAINSLGFRDRECSLEKPPGTRRIVVLGDSITFGTALEAELRYPARLEARLRAHEPPVEVLNLGVTGYDTLQEAAMLEHVGLALEPELAIVGYCMNDLGTQSVQAGELERIARYRGWRSWSRLCLWITMRIDQARNARGAFDLNEEGRFAARHRGEIADIGADAALLAEMEKLRKELAALGRPLPGYDPLPWYGSPAHVGRLRYSLEALAAVAAQRELPVLLAVLPSLRGPAFQKPVTIACGIVEREARRVGFDVLRFEEVVLARNPAELKQSTDDLIHYNAAGHELIAAQLLRHLEGSGFAPAR